VKERQQVIQNQQATINADLTINVIVAIVKNSFNTTATK